MKKITVGALILALVVLVACMPARPQPTAPPNPQATTQQSASQQESPLTSPTESPQIPVDTIPESEELVETKPAEIEQSEYAKMLKALTSLMDEKLVFDNKDYRKGAIPKGEYAFIEFGGGRYYSEEDANGDIIDNENFDAFGYVYVHGLGNIKTNGILVSVNAFETLGVSGARELYKILHEIDVYYFEGMYKVGYDIDAGEYIVDSFNERAYYAVLTGPIGDNEIVKNDNFNGEKTVNLSEGQYLTFNTGVVYKEDADGNIVRIDGE